MKAKAHLDPKAPVSASARSRRGLEDPRSRDDEHSVGLLLLM